MSIKELIDEAANTPAGQVGYGHGYTDALEQAVKCVPTTWLDPLLSGPAAIKFEDRNVPQVEALLLAIRARIRALLEPSDELA